MSSFDASMHEQAMHDLQLNAELRLALEDHQFEMFYQPIVNLVTGRTDRFETLVRWNHPARGLVLPDQFLPRLTIEITEGVIMRRPDSALRLMRDMHEAGFELHIDDFGTGYSSLETLHRFPVDAFKIDRSFIAGLTTSDRTEELVRAIITMGRALGLAVVAEGVETQEQLQSLQEIRCRAAQGFLFMPAVPADVAPSLLAQVLGQRSASPQTVPGGRGNPADHPVSLVGA